MLQGTIAKALRRLAGMASAAVPHATIDWASARVRGRVLTLPLTGALSGAWTSHLAGLVERLPQQPGVDTIEVGAAHITVAPVRRGGAADVHDLLERLVEETNATFAQEDDATVAVAPVDRHERTRSIAGSVALIVLAGAAVALQWAEWEAPVRPVVVLTFVVFGPGWAILRLWDLADGWIGVGLVIALSLSLAMVVAGATVYAGVWSPLGTLCGLAGLTILAAVVALLRVRGHARGAPPVLVGPWSVTPGPDR
jgi:hypothetical protein